MKLGKRKSEREMGIIGVSEGKHRITKVYIEREETWRISGREKSAVRDDKERSCPVGRKGKGNKVTKRISQDYWYRYWV